jgi:hypothetical protein
MESHLMDNTLETAEGVMDFKNIREDDAERSLFRKESSLAARWARLWLSGLV